MGFALFPLFRGSKYILYINLSLSSAQLIQQAGLFIGPLLVKDMQYELIKYINNNIWDCRADQQKVIK